MLKDLSAKRLHSRAAEQFVREIAHQAIIRDDSMMKLARSVITDLGQPPCFQKVCSRTHSF